MPVVLHSVHVNNVTDVNCGRRMSIKYLANDGIYLFLM